MSLLNNNSADTGECPILSSPAIVGQLDAVAGIRMVSSLLGFFGAASIIFSVIWKRRLLHSEIHPIFMLSLSDCLLAILWITGSSVWLSSAKDNALWCYALTLITAIMECVAVDLTVVYAIFAYVKIKKTDLNSVLTHSNRNDLSWKITLLVYIIAWFLPLFFIVIISFGTTVNTHLLSSSVSNCSCCTWCLPSLINIVPFVKCVDESSIHFPEKLLVGLGIVIILHYLIAFLSLLILYKKILNKIKKIQQEHEQLVFGHKIIDSQSKYGSAEGNRIIVGHSEAKKRIILFLTVFISSGLFNMILAIVLVAFLSPHLTNIHGSMEKQHNNALLNLYMAFLYAQSLTLPLQGFMNAIVYGWTREDFVQTIAINNMTEEMNSDVQISDGTELNESRREQNFEETLTLSDSDN